MPRELIPQSDPRTPLDTTALFAASRPVLRTLTRDLLHEAREEPAVRGVLRARWQAQHEAAQMGEPFEVWQRRLAGHVAGAWFLSIVFVRTLEDRGLLAPRRIAGRPRPERDSLLALFRELGALHTTAGLFDARHNPIWLLAPPDVTPLLDFFRAPDPDAPFYRFGQSDTRFLGDLYQHLDGDARARYALLQTPPLVESFILDRTLERAVEQLGIGQVTLLDPACGSGHFLLGAFERLYRYRLESTSGLNSLDAARLSADAVYGMDINPFAVSIARFRLALAVLEKSGLPTLDSAVPFPVHVAVADSLLPARSQPPEADEAAKPMLRKRYEVIAGNPPFTTVKDRRLRERYRKLYRSAAGNYSIAAPFIERFFGLSAPGGFVGMITASSFMNREFGRKLIEAVFPEKNIELVVNTAGAFIPGHGTPTAILVGRNELPRGATVQVVVAKRADESMPASAREGLMWQSIARHWNSADFEDEFVSTSRVPRSALERHPIHLGGGAAAALKSHLEALAQQRLAELAFDIGRSTHTGEDEAFFMPAHSALRLGISPARSVPLVKGEQVRDWAIARGEVSLFPYDPLTGHPETPVAARESRYYWRLRTVLRSRRDFGQTIEQRGLLWFEHSMFFPRRFLHRPQIAFAEVATHNHFVLDEGGKLFKQTAPILTLLHPGPEDTLLALLGYLNSSTACFWMKQVAHRKSSASQQHHADSARAAYQFTGTLLSRLPIAPRAHPGLVSAVRELGELGKRREEWLSGASLRRSLPAQGGDLPVFFEHGWHQYDQAKARSIYLQEEIDWSVYVAFGLCTEAEAGIQLSGAYETPPGSRPFEHLAGYDAGISRRARKPVAQPETPGRPPHWERRIPLLLREGIRLLETREFKRQWRDTEQNIDPAEFRRAVQQSWIVRFVADEIENVFATSSGILSENEIESALLSGSGGVPVRALADFLGCSVRALIQKPLTTEAVPYLAAMRHTESGLEKRLAWERTWALQRREDTGSRTPAPTPPPYEQNDYRCAAAWHMRHKLDIPKERFIAYPGCESDADGAPVYGWAGWDDQEQARALFALYQKRRIDERWGKDRLLPLLAGIRELIPWVKQWHSGPNAAAAEGTFGDELARFVERACHELGILPDALPAWRPPRARRNTGRRKRLR